MNTTDTTPPTARQRAHALVVTVRSGPIGDWLRQRAEEVADAAADPAHARIWVKATTVVLLAVPALGLLATLLSVYASLDRSLAHAAAHTPIGAHLGDLVAVTTHPVRRYVHAHAATLPVSASVLYAAWQLIGAATWFAAWRRSNAARVTWVLLGAVTGAMVWSATPVAGQALATGTFTVLWALVSIPALRGLSLHARTHLYVDARPQAVR